ncbi:MAG: hypothetical protein LBC99_04865 [Spirochaetota bacterium]|jgi:signal transduction histidine kinase|nr:hypothetical protein [Spirochaetota bacterium]
MAESGKQKNRTARRSDSEIIANLKKRIEELEQITEMFDQTSELSRLERLHAERLIQAHEELRNLTEKERREADAIIEAQQRVQELSAKERLDADRLVAAHEEVGRLAQQERKDAESVIKAHERVGELSVQERLDAERLLAAHEEVERLAQQERKDAESVISAQERVRNLSEDELRRAENFLAAKERIEQLAAVEIKRRDTVLSAILSMNSRMHFAQLVEDLFTHILNDIMILFGARRGFVARSAGNTMRIAVKNGYPQSEVPEAAATLAKVLAGEEVPGIFARIVSEELASGLVYIERLPGNGKLETLDSGFLEVIASQLSLGFGGILLRERYIRQNFELRKLAVLKGNFIGHLSTDLQKPMEKIIGLLEKKTEKDTKKAQEDMILLKKGLDKIISIFSLQQEVDEMYTHTIMIDDLIQKIVASYQDEIKKRNVTIEYNYPERIYSFSGNLDTMNTIVDEIICNSIVYNRIGGKVLISIIQDDRQCKVVVRDTGVGVSKERLPKVFERFYRAPSSSELHDRGAGLGLYIVKEFIEAYGGSITFTSEEGKGSEIALIFPLWHIGGSSTTFS